MAGSTISNLVTISVTLGSNSYPSPLTIIPAGFIDPSPVIPAGVTGLVATISGGYVLNQGTVAGGVGAVLHVLPGPDYAGGIGIELAGGSLTNTGSIAGGVGGFNTLFEYGGAGGYGVVATGSSLTNDGTISGGYGGGLGVVRYGGSGGGGVDLTSSSLTNNGLIAGGNGVGRYNDPVGTGGTGVSLAAGSTLTNTGEIIGGTGGAGSYSPSTVNGTGGNGVDVASSGLTNEGMIIGGSGGGKIIRGGPGPGVGGVGADVTGGTLTNNGMIGGGYGGGVGVALSDASVLTNNSVIGGGYLGGVGVALSGGSVLTNKGNIGGGGGGQYQGLDGLVLLSGGAGVDATNGTITNDGGINGGRGAAGVYLTNGILTNNGGIAGGRYLNSGLSGAGVAATNSTLTNNGMIAGYYYGVVLASGGSLTNAAAAVISGDNGVSISGGGTVVNAGTIRVTGGYDYNLNGAAVIFGGAGTDRLVDDPGAVFAGSIVAQGSLATLELASAASAGTITGIGTSFSGFGTITVDADATWVVTGSVTGSGMFDLGAGSDLTFDGGVDATSPIHFTAVTGTLGLGDPADFAPAVYGLQPGDAIDFTSITSTGSIIAGVDGFHHLTLTSGGILLTEINLDPTQSFAGDLFHAAPDGHDGTLVTETPLCFLEGTLIATPSGEIPIEHLGVGDMVVTARGAVRPIVWIGTGRVLATRGRRNAATPIIVRKNALADNVPHRDLRVTKAHSFYLDGVLIPVEFLVNHRSIQWDDVAQEVVLYHIELETHDVLVANGAPAESYRDDGNRWLFQNANSGWGLPPQAPCAPVLTAGRRVDAVWRRLLERAGPAKSRKLTDDADLHVVMDGQRLDAAEPIGEAHIFLLSAMPSALLRPSALRITSRAAAPAELGLARDPRVLGVALRRLMVRKGTRFRVIEAKDDRLTDGFHAFEPDQGFRWTDGNAAIPADLYAGFTAPLELVLHIGATTRYLADGDGQRVAA